MKKLVGKIDATPRWQDLVPTYIFWLKAGTENEKKVAEEELLRLGKIADERREIETCPVCKKSMCFERKTKEEPPEYDVCNECGKHICIDCSKDIDETPYCPECFKEKKI